jgi:uncharacterized membrane protein YjjB (DUF3815 family)
VDQLWSWALAAVGISGVFLAGKRRKVGWAIGVGVQFLWMAYANVTHQWGFAASAIVYGSFYGLNWWRWYREDRSVATTPTPWRVIPAGLGYPKGTWLIIGSDDDNGASHTVAVATPEDGNVVITVPCDDDTHPSRAEADARYIVKAVNLLASQAVTEDQ